MSSNLDNTKSRGTIRTRECTACGKQGTAKVCAKCKRVQYCGSECQRADWPRHVIDCNTHTGRPVTSAHHLVRAIMYGIPLTDLQARADWGLDKAIVVSPYSCQMLLLLYKGLIKENNVTAKRLHQWRVDGTLVPEISAVYEAMSPESRGKHYSWFLSHKYILEKPTPLTLDEIEQAECDMDTRTWAVVKSDFKDDSTTTMDEFLQTLDISGRECWEMGKSLMNSQYPACTSPLWVQFGFCACPTKEDEVKLVRAYHSLFMQCPFPRFCYAYSQHSLVALFRAYEIELFSSPNTPSIFYRGLSDVLSVPFKQIKSVWWLKRLAYLFPKDADIDLRSFYPLNLQYGFVNCKDKKEAHTLMEIYRNFFSSATSNPFDLEKARRIGRLDEFFFEDLGIKMGKKRRERYTHWLANHLISISPLAGDVVDPRWMCLHDSLSPGQTIVVGVVVAAPAASDVEDEWRGRIRRQICFTRDQILNFVRIPELRQLFQRRYKCKTVVLLPPEQLVLSV